MQLQGSWHPKWQPVVDVFLKNQVEGDDGAALGLVIDRELVLNIVAGSGRNRAMGIESEDWTDKTLVNVFSAGKALVAICVLQLVERDELSLDAPIADYWPEFSQKSKSAITLRQVLSHRSGLSAFHQVIAQDQIFNWEQITQAIAEDEPWWQPDSAQGYSPFIYGWILGEVIQRVTGISFNQYFQQNVAEPLGIDCYFGVLDDKLPQIVDTTPLKKIYNFQDSSSSDADSFALGKIMKADPRGVTNRAFSNPISLMTSTNSLAWRQAQIPAANAHTNALGLAKIYGDLARSSGQLLSQKTLINCSQEQTFEEDKVLGLPLRFSCGFMLSQPQRPDCRYGHGKMGFGHPGAGGSLGFADPDLKIGFGYVTQRMGQSVLIDQRASKLVDAVYAVLESEHE